MVIYGVFGMGKLFLFDYIKYFYFWDDKGLNFLEVLIVYYNCEGLFMLNSFW